MPKPTDKEKKEMKERNLAPDAFVSRIRGDSRRDIMVHVAVTQIDRYKGVKVLGEEDKELGQWAVEIPANHVPMTRAQAKAMFEKLTLHAYKRMMACNLIRE